MSFREQILAEIAALPDNKLSELSAFIHARPNAHAAPPQVRKTGFLSELKTIQIKGPKDFAENIANFSTKRGAWSIA